MLRFVICGGLASAAAFASAYPMIWFMDWTEPRMSREAWSWLVASVAFFGVLGVLPAIWWFVYMALGRLADGIAERMPRHHREGGGR